MEQQSFWKFILEKLNQSNLVILMCVVESKGSSPGRHGFKMAVARDGMVGSIGGGIMEHKFVELAKERLGALYVEPLIRKQVHNKSARVDQSGMICSGDQTILMYSLNYFVL